MHLVVAEAADVAFAVTSVLVDVADLDVFVVVFFLICCESWLG